LAQPDGERKSVEPMAKRLPDGNEQAMQQFVGQSPWEWEPVWQRLARRMVRELEPAAVWVIDDTEKQRSRENAPAGAQSAAAMHTEAEADRAPPKCAALWQAAARLGQRGRSAGFTIVPGNNFQETADLFLC
jgi:hypothetical protein